MSKILGIEMSVYFYYNHYIYNHYLKNSTPIDLDNLNELKLNNKQEIKIFNDLICCYELGDLYNLNNILEYIFDLEFVDFLFYEFIFYDREELLNTIQSILFKEYYDYDIEKDNFYINKIYENSSFSEKESLDLYSKLKIYRQKTYSDLFYIKQ